MNDINKKENIAIEVEKGRAALRQARILFESDEYDGSVSRAYYAVFSKRYSTILSHSQKAREESDYQGEIPFTKEDADLRLAEADEFIRHVADFLAKEGF